MSDTVAPGPIQSMLEADHVRLEGLLDRATASAAVDSEAYAQFRKGLLRHIGMEEKILLPAAQRAAGEPHPEAGKLRLQHGAIVSLLVPSPTPAIVHALRSILAIHNLVEEGPQGLYAVCEKQIGASAAELLAQLQDAPEVPVHPHLDTPIVLESARRALGRAGFAHLLDAAAAANI